MHGRAEADIAAEIGEAGAGALKKYVTESVNGFLAPIRERRRALEDLDYIGTCCARANRRANEMADATVRRGVRGLRLVYKKS